MNELSRRQALAIGTLASIAGALPAWAQERTAAAAAVAGWNLGDLFPSDAAWDTARRASLAEIAGLTGAKGTLGKNAAMMAAALVAQSDAARRAMRVFTYAYLKGDEDLRVAANQEKVSQATDLLGKLGEATSWTAPEILAIGEPKVRDFIAANETLRTRFDFSLENILRQAPHTLTLEGEALLAAAAAPFQGPGEIRGQLVASDIPRPTITLSTGTKATLDDQGYTLHRDAPNRADRKAVFDAFWASYAKFGSSLGAALASKLKADTFVAKARHYPTAVEMSLSSNDVPLGVYTTLVAEINTALPQLHRYFELRRRLLKLPDMAYYDIYPPLVQLDRTVTLDQMRTTTLDALKPLGPDYTAKLARATAARWMDPWPRPGKASGAYMMPAAAKDVHPYLLLNLSDKYDGLTTYAHEWGHAMHTLLATEAQPYEKSDYPLFLAEIASTCNEVLLAAYMVERAKTREEKLFYLGQQLEGMRGTFFRQGMFAEFELKAHQKAEAGEGLSGEAFSAIYLDLLKRYHGPKVAIDPAYAIEWAYIGHFYSSFYVYQYATCISAGTYFARQILRGGAKERDNYLGVLKAGGSDHPVAILKRAGLDMTSPAPYRAIVQVFKETLDQCEALMG